MMCVLDSNIGVKWLLQEDQSEKARIVRDEYARGLHELLAPDVFTVECAHALTRAQRQARVTTVEVNAFMADLLTTLPQFHPHQPLLPRAIEISLQVRHGVYGKQVGPPTPGTVRTYRVGAMLVEQVKRERMIWKPFAHSATCACPTSKVGCK
jgi:predicted nucleic acid-binding protein